MKRIAVLLLATIFFTSCETLKLADLQTLTTGKTLSTETMVAGLKEALSKGSDGAVNQLSKTGGFYDNKLFRIKMPKQLDEVTDTMKTIGLASLVENFEKKMNLAAEHATKSAGPIFLDAIKQMKFSDAKAILYGSDTAATNYLRKSTSTKLLQIYKPIVQKNMNDVGVVQVYNKLMAKYDAIPFKSKPKFSLSDYITNNALNAMFDVLAEKEKKIRQDPTARTTELLKEVFEK